MNFLWRYLLPLLLAMAPLAGADNNNVSIALSMACAGDLSAAYERIIRLNNETNDNHIHSAEILHIASALELILFANIDSAAALHLKAKRVNSAVTPPLAQLFLQGEICGGLNDVFYVSAVAIKQFVDAPLDLESRSEVALRSHQTLVTLLADSGLPHLAELHLLQCLQTDPEDAALHLRSILMTPAVFESSQHLKQTRTLLENRLNLLLANTSSLSLTSLNEFSLSSTFYLVYQGFSDVDFLTKLDQLYVTLHPALDESPLQLSSSDSFKHSKLRIGFVSSYFRRHSICKLFCGMIMGLDATAFDVFVFSSTPQSQEDSFTANLRESTTYIRIGKPLMQNKRLVTDQEIDVLIYLDVGMDPSMKIWASSRLAPIQVSTLESLLLPVQ